MSFGEILVATCMHKRFCNIFLFKNILAAVFLSQSYAEFENVQIAFYYGEGSHQLYSITSMHEITRNEAYHNNKTTLFYIHGFRENLTSESVQTIINAFLFRKTHNILVLDWSKYAAGNYMTQAIPNMVQIGRMVGEWIYFMIFLNVFELNKFHGKNFWILIF